MKNNFIETKKRIGYTPRQDTLPEVYQQLGFMCGLEVHQQLKTDKKLFCNCPAGVFQDSECYEAEVVRHMRPTLSEMGGYDGTALMEFKTRKTVVYRIANVTTCTYDVDDTPPFKINRQALTTALEIALLLKTNIVGELHIARKQYLDGSIPTGFQRTGILGIEGQIPLKNKTLRIAQLSIEEDSCREVSDVGHIRTYTTDRLGMPLIETVTYPDLKTPEEAAEAAQYIRFLNRSTGKVRTGIGAAREDVNVSITGGTRIEIKGVSHISYIPELVHNEAFRQKSLLEIRSQLLSRVPNYEQWNLHYVVLNEKQRTQLANISSKPLEENLVYTAINLPKFRDILSFFTQPGRMFSDEISDRLKVIACIEKPNMMHSEDLYSENGLIDFPYLQKLLGSTEEDAQILLWCPKEDLSTALETIEERCRFAFQGVPKETRKSFPDGTTMFERVLPGSDRMYPDTDSAPIAIHKDFIDQLRKNLPVDVDQRISQLTKWGVPEDAFPYLLRYNLLPLVQKIAWNFGVEPRFICILLSHRLKYLQGKIKPDSAFSYERIYELFDFLHRENINFEILYSMLPIAYKHPQMPIPVILEQIHFSRQSLTDILALIPSLHEKFSRRKTSKSPEAEFQWVMKNLKHLALGNLPLSKLADAIRKGGIKI